MWLSKMGCAWVVRRRTIENHREVEREAQIGEEKVVVRWCIEEVEHHDAYRRTRCGHGWQGRVTGCRGRESHRGRDATQERGEKEEKII